MQSRKILIIEDEASIADLLAYSLHKEGFEVRTAGTEEQGMRLVSEFKPELILLDLMLPDGSGYDICRAVSRDTAIPIVMLTAKSDIVDRILGIELGADDFITKPFDLREVTVRIKAIFRRIELTSEALESAETEETLSAGHDITICKSRREVLKDGKRIDLTNKEYELLLFMAENRGRVFSRADLLDKVWGFEFAGDTRTVDIHVQRLRKKLDEDGGVAFIETVFGIGYKLA